MGVNESNDEVLACESSIRKIAADLCRGRSWSDLEEDVASVVRLVFLKASKTYDPLKGSLTAYARRCAVHEARRFLDTELRRGICVPVWKKKSTEQRFIESLSGHEFLQSREGEFEVPPKFLDRVRESLTSRQWIAVEARFILGKTWKEVGEVLGCSGQGAQYVVDVAIARLTYVFRINA